MDVLGQFFALKIDPGLLIYGTYNPWLVALSVAMAMFASTMGLNAVSQAREIQVPHLRRVILLAASMALGCGVWAMHFIGMLSFALCTTVKYNVGITTLSLIPSVAASWVALRLLSQDHVSKRQLAVSGTLVGAGIGTMHYTGMAAMSMSASLHYDPMWFALSIVVAVALAVLALWIRFGVTSFAGGQPRLVLNAAAGVVMGLAISGMHYTGMAAARFIGVAQSKDVLQLIDPVPLAMSIALVTVVATVMVASASGLAQYRQLIEQLQSKESKLQAILDTAIDGIIVFDGRGHIVKINPGASRIYGWGAGELVDRSIALLMREPFRSQATQNMAAFIDRIEGRLGREFTEEGVRQDGSTVPIRLVLGKAMVESGTIIYVAYVSDISERVGMEAAQRASERQFRTLIANIPGIAYRCRLEAGWPMDFISDAVERLTGYPASDFLGDQPKVRLGSLIPEEDAVNVAKAVSAAVGHGLPIVLEFRMQHRDDTMRWMWSHGSIVRDDAGVVSWIDGVLLDISERRQMEEALRDAKERAEAAAHARSNFLANMSHEIRTPMNAIIGFTDVVLGGSLQEGQRRHLETVRRSAHSLLQLLNDILDTSKLDRGALELEEIDFNVREVMADLCEEQSIHAQKKGLQLRYVVDEGVERVIRGDPYRLRQVLMNLVGNAVKFTERGFVELRVRREARHLHFVVQDTGIGIASDRLGSIFDPFTQADASMSRRFGGTGLGTTISRQLVELMKGRIWVESELGQGSSFHVSVPMVVGREALPSSRQVQSVTHLPPIRILAVDDVPQNTELLSVVLSQLGHEVVAAADGMQALSLYQRGRFDVVLMDVQMPVMDGWQASREIRAMEAKQGLTRTPIIALSAGVMPEDRLAATESGMDGFAAKPVDLAPLTAEIARVTGLAAQASPQPESKDHLDYLPLDPAIVDQRRALKRWGMLAPYRHALEQFARSHQHCLTDEDAMPPPLPASRLLQEVHAIKGVAANLGLSQLASVCDQIELSAQSATDGQLAPLWNELRAVMRATVMALSTVLLDSSSNGHDAGGAQEIGLAQVRSLIEVLSQAFKRGEPLDDELQTLLDGVRPWTSLDDRRRVQSAVDDFDFDAADKALKQLADQLPQEESTHASI